MATLKPAAKAIIIVAFLGAAGFGVSTYLDHRPVKPVVAETPVTQSPQSTEVKAPEPATVQVAPEAKSEPAQEPAASPSNSGMDALLKRTK